MWIKLNSLVDPDHPNASTRPRRPACDRPGGARHLLPATRREAGVSDNIRCAASSIDFLEHASYCCGLKSAAVAQGKVFLSSADWMPRNLDRRVELLLPGREPDGPRTGARPDHGRVNLKDDGQSWISDAGRHYIRPHRARSRSSRTTIS